MAKRPGPGPDEIDADLLERSEMGGGDPAGSAGGAGGKAPRGIDGGGPPEPGDAAAPPLTDELDLHTFRPRDCADLVAEYLEAARDAGLLQVRIVHGKGTGALRRIVHGVLDRHPAVRSYRLAGEHGGGWGATVVELQPRTLGA